MTPEALDQTNKLEPSLIQRFTHKFEIPALSDEDANRIVVQRLRKARIVDGADLSPFPGDTLSQLRPTTKSSPRMLIKVLWYSLSLAAQKNECPPISVTTLKQAEEELYPGSIDG